VSATSPLTVAEEPGHATLWQRFQAAMHDRVGARFEREHGAELRRKQLAEAHGRVLEIGGGTGANLEHYPAQVSELVVTEPNAGMLRRARERLQSVDREATLVQAGAEKLPFPDASFDTVVGTVVLCTIPDPAAALREVRRVLKPGGSYLFAEHVRSTDPKSAKWQDRLEKPWGIIGGGCHPNRDTGATLAAAGFDVQVTDEGRLPIVPRLVKPFIAGRAVNP
jgi:SAM-dependent methyltransferase